MRSHRGIFLILDKFVHLGGHMRGILSGNLTQNNIRNLIIAHNFGVKII